MTFIRSLAIFLGMLGLVPAAQAAPDWYVGYSFIYTDRLDTCVFMRFSDEAFSVRQADRLYRAFEAHLRSHSGHRSTLNHTRPSSAWSRGQTGGYMAEQFRRLGRGVCTKDGRWFDRVLFVSLFPCDYQNERQMCIRQYVDAGRLDLWDQGIDPGPASLGGIFIKYPVWDAAMVKLKRGRGEIPYAITSALDQSARPLDLLFRR